ncbi:MAG: hypothetical protein ACPGXY_00205 [Alphaproteobacteria bacterium]
MVYSLVILIAILAAPANAQFVKAGIHKGFTRIAFNWDKKTKYEVVQDFPKIRIQFDGKKNITDKELQFYLPPDVSVSKIENAPKLAIELAVDKPADIRTFRVKNSVMMDVVWAQPETPMIKPASSGIMPGHKPSKDAAKKPQEAIEEVVEDAVEEAIEEPETPAKTEKKIIPIKVVEDDAGMHLHITTDGESKAVLFPYNKTLIMVVDKPINFISEYKAKDGQDQIVSIAPFTGENYGGFQLRLGNDWHGKLVPASDGWKLNIRRSYNPNINPMIFKIVKDPRDQPELYIKHEGMGEVHDIIVPSDNSLFKVVPVGPELAGHPQARILPQIDVWKSYQGLVFQAKGESVEIKSRPGNLTIASKGGLVMSPAEDRGLKREVYYPESMFDFGTWRPKGDKMAGIQRQLEYEIISKPKDKRRGARLNLAQYYIVTGRDLEAIGLLGAMEVYNPTLDEYPKFHAIKGLAAYLAGRHDLAIAELSHPSLRRDVESQLWLHAAKSALKLPNDIISKVKGSQAIIKKYPDFLRNRIVMQAFDEAYRLKKPAKPMLPLLVENALTKHQHLRLRLIGAMQLAKEDKRGALQRLKDIAKHRDYAEGVRATLAMTTMLRKEGDLKPEDELKMIKRLRYRWKGDELELRVLLRLGGLYIQQKNYVDGLHCLRQAIKRFPKETSKAHIDQKVQDYFVRAIRDSRENSPLLALGLYQKFDNFIPKDERRTEIINTVVDIMIDLNLVNKASQLLLDQVTSDDIPEDERQKKLTQYAVLTLLAHKPKKTLQALASSPEEEHRYLKAQAHLMMKEYDKVEEVLEGDSSEKANTLRMKVLLSRKEWAKLTSVLADMIRGQEESNKPVDPRLVMTLAVSLLFQQDEKGLSQIRGAYGDIMSKSPLKNAFNVVTSNDQIDVWNKGEIVEQIEEAQKIGDMLEDYRAKLRSEGITGLA